MGLLQLKKITLSQQGKKNLDVLTRILKIRATFFPFLYFSFFFLNHINILRMAIELPHKCPKEEQHKLRIMAKKLFKIYTVHTVTHYVFKMVHSFHLFSLLTLLRPRKIYSYSQQSVIIEWNICVENEQNERRTFGPKALDLSMSHSMPLEIKNLKMLVILKKSF